MVRRIIDQRVSARQQADGSLEYEVFQVSFDDEERDDFTGELDGSPFANGLPLTTKDQRCSCGAEPVWVYGVAAADREFRVGGKGFTLPSFVTLCAACKELAEHRDAKGLLERRLRREDDSDWEQEITEASSTALARAQLTAGRPLRPADSA